MMRTTSKGSVDLTSFILEVSQIFYHIAEYTASLNQTADQLTTDIIYIEMNSCCSSNSLPVKNPKNNSQLIIYPESSNLTEAAEKRSESSFVT